MKAILIFFFTNTFLFAQTNKLTLIDQSGSPQINRTITVSRYFAQGEILGFARPRINGEPAVFWQSDVKTRWPDGTVRFALVSVEVTVPGCPRPQGCDSIDIDFISSATASSGGPGLTQDDLLAFDAGGGAGTWGAQIQASINGVTESISARAMIANGQFTVLESGPLRHSILVREASSKRTTSFGFRCTGKCKSPYAAPDTVWVDAGASEQYKSMRPSFVVTFYPRWKHVETDYVIDNDWFDRFQDQRFRLRLFEGGAETSQWYDSGAEIVLPAGSRIWEEHWTPALPNTKIDLNFAYMTATKVLPQWDLDLHVGPAAVDLESAAFKATDQGATASAALPHLGWGQWLRWFSTAGGRPDIGLFPRWTVRYLYTFDPRLRDVLIGNAKAMFHAPIHTVESDSSRKFDNAGAVSGFNRMISINTHLTFRDGPPGPGTLVSDMPTLVGPVTCYDRSFGGFCSDVDSKNVVNQWEPDVSHQPNAFSVPYLVTGKYVFLEELQFWANWTIAAGSPGLPPNESYGRRDTWGFINNTWSERAFAWGLRALGHAALFSWDNTPEKDYLMEKMNYNIGVWEGKLNIPNGAFGPPNPDDSLTFGCTQPFDPVRDTSPWCMGRFDYERGRVNPLNWICLPGGFLAEGIDVSKSAAAGSLWMQHFVSAVFGHLREMGFRVGKIHDRIAGNLVSQILDSTYNPYLVSEYRIPVSNSTFTGYLQKWSDVKDAFLMTASLSAPLSKTDGVISVAAVDFAQSNPRYSYNYPGYIQIGSELVRFSGASNLSKTFTADVDTDVITSPKHGYGNGQIIRVLGSLSAPLKLNTDYYVIGATADTLQLSLDGTNPIDITSVGGAQSFNTVQLQIDRCGSTFCRGMSGTTAAPHTIGETVSRVPAVIPQALVDDVENGYPWFARAAVSFAAGYQVTSVDQGNGALLNGEAAWAWLSSRLSLDRLGQNRSSCTGLSVHTCDNPQWAFVPRQRRSSRGGVAH